MQIKVYKSYHRRIARLSSIARQRAANHPGVLQKPKAVCTSGLTIKQKRYNAAKMRNRMTPAERKLWEHLKPLGFRAQEVMFGYIADFVYHPGCLIVEADGKSHESKKSWDSNRDRVFRNHGYITLRFRNSKIMSDTEKVLQAIRERML